MQAVKETTVWKDGTTANHTYLLDGDKLVAYIKKDTKEPFYFKNPIKGFSRSGRKFEILKQSPFKVKISASTVTQVTGSKGEIYEVDTETNTCTCPGFTFRGNCKHIEKD